MTNQEFSDEFDILINNMSVLGTDNPRQFDEYEKSVVLTEAQETIVKSLYNGNLIGKSFEETEELRRYLSSLVKDYSPEYTEGTGITNISTLFTIPKDVWYITYETVSSNDDSLGCLKGTALEVVPVTQDELHKVIKNPFRGPNKRRVLRLDLENNIVELISKFSIDKYQIRYLAKPTPIILVDLPEGLTIDNINKETECKLNSNLHRIILETAVSIALKSRSSADK